MRRRTAFAIGLATALAAASFLMPAASLPGATLWAAARERPRRTAAGYDAPGESWREGPVRYLLGKDEDDAFRALRTDDDRAAFIASFWSRRDPDLSTPQNEYRDRFYGRVEAANLLFTDSTKDGWKTDRGKIYILLGPPDDLDERKLRSISADVILWTYRDPPPGSGVSPHSTVRFARDLTGEYRLSNNILLSSLESSLSVGLQTQAMQMQNLPETRRLLDGVVMTRTYPVVPFRTHRDFFASTGGDTFTVLTLGIRPVLLAGTATGPAAAAPLAAGTAPAPPGRAPAQATGAPVQEGSGAIVAAAATGPGAGDRLEVMARLVGGPGLPTYDWAGPTGFREGESPAGPDAVRLFQAGAPVRPGDYTVHYAVVDRERGVVHSYHEPLQVPDFRDDRFALSSVSLASRLERLDEARPSGYTAPFVFGNLRVLPRADEAFHTGENLAFYFHVHGAASDPIDGRPDLDITYRFLHVPAPGSRAETAAGATPTPGPTPLGRPIVMTRQRSQVQGYTLPLHDWPRGDFRLRVEVTDNLTGRRAAQEVDFRVL